jgi:EpsI family protein
MTKLAVVLLFLALDFYIYGYLATDEVVPPRIPLTQFPTVLDEWKCAAREDMTEDVVSNLGVTDYLICNYVKAESAVGVYIGYHASQVRREGGGSKENIIHPPAHCLPGSGWDIIASGHYSLAAGSFPNGRADVRRLVIAKGESRALVYYWYNERGRVIADDYLKILDLFWDRATRGRTDGALVRLTTPLVAGKEEQSEAELQDLADRIVSRLATYVPN